MFGIFFYQNRFLLITFGYLYALLVCGIDDVNNFNYFSDTQKAELSVTEIT